MKEILPGILLILLLVGCGSDMVKVDLAITETETNNDEVIVTGTTNLPNNTVLLYSLNGYEGSVKVSEGKWVITESLRDIEEWDQYNVYSESELEVWVGFAPLTEELDEVDQPTEIYEVYGEGGVNIKSADNVEEFEDGAVKRVVVEKTYNK